MISCMFPMGTRPRKDWSRRCGVLKMLVIKIIVLLRYTSVALRVIRADFD